LRTTAPTIKNHSLRVSPLMLSSLLPPTVLHALESMLQMYGILLSRQN
jgi:hypothetical protein